MQPHKTDTAPSIERILNSWYHRCMKKYYADPGAYEVAEMWRGSVSAGVVGDTLHFQGTVHGDKRDIICMDALRMVNRLGGIDRKKTLFAPTVHVCGSLSPTYFAEFGGRHPHHVGWFFVDGNETKEKVGRSLNLYFVFYTGPFVYTIYSKMYAPIASGKRGAIEEAQKLCCKDCGVLISRMRGTKK